MGGLVHEEEDSVDVESARSFFAAMLQADEFFASHFAGPGYPAVEYEDLVADLEGVSSPVFSFLGVGEHPVTMVTGKQVGASEVALVRNLDVLESEYRRFCKRHGRALPVATTRTNPPFGYPLTGASARVSPLRFGNTDRSSSWGY